MSACGPNTLDHTPSFLMVLWSTDTYLRSWKKTHSPAGKEEGWPSNLTKSIPSSRIQIFFYVAWKWWMSYSWPGPEGWQALHSPPHHPMYWYLAYPFLSFRSSAIPTKYKSPKFSPFWNYHQQNVGEYLHSPDHSKHVLSLVPSLCSYTSAFFLLSPLIYM